MCMCVYAHMSAGALRGQKRALYSLELELGAFFELPNVDIGIQT